MAQCLKCEKSMEFERCNGESEGNNTGNTRPIRDGGFIKVSFHYGSRHDQCLGYHGRKTSRIQEDSSFLEKMLSCDNLQSYICDDCFEKNVHLFEGWDEYTKIEQTRRV